MEEHVLIGYQFGMKHQRESANRALPSGFQNVFADIHNKPSIILLHKHMYMEESNTNMLTKIQLHQIK